jgi:2-succinyl-5-enolpyruvyl-6-hydroxy-3-cyclohexene-1-carboxylate synthase
MRELAAAGVTHVSVAPGSRSAPLTLAAARAEREGLMNVAVHVDERSGGFFALGVARGSGQPAAVVCTSGTAAANLLPAVVEASYGRVPLIALTADRPPELRDTGAWQAIDQVKLYGDHVRWFAELALPESNPFLARTVCSVASRAAYAAVGEPAGPVHINVPFREPLVPAGDGEAAWAAVDQLLAAAEVGVKGATRSAGRSTVQRGAELHGDALDDIADKLRAARRGVIVSGELPGLAVSDPRWRRSVARLAEATGFPVLGEALGRLRFGTGSERTLAGHDAYLRDGPWLERHRPDVVLRFGASPVWKYGSALAADPRTLQIVVDPGGTWDDPERRGGIRVVAPAASTALGLAERLESRAPEVDPAWHDAWTHADSMVAKCFEERWVSPDPRTSLWIPQTVVVALPEHGVLAAANSMAIRDVESFTRQSAKHIRVVANRGAAGIDGTLSWAAGIGWGSGAPVALLCGDLAFAHDVGGLAALAKALTPVVIVVVNDDGGGIFSYLPYAGWREFEQYFVTPSGLDIALACAAFGVPHDRADSPPELADALSAGLTRRGASVVEVAVDRETNTAAHRTYWDAVVKAL